MSDTTTLEALDIPLERDVFMRGLIRHLAGSLEDVIGLEEASGYISLVGQAMGEEIEDAYKRTLGVDKLSPEQAAAVMVDLKRRIKGDFSVAEQDEERIVLVNRACPFGEKVLGRPSMCMMTSNVFGHIAAESTGFAKVVLDETIAQGDRGCRIVVHLAPGAAADADEGREYFQSLPPDQA